jgi:hypothetical protein
MNSIVVVVECCLFKVYCSHAGCRGLGLNVNRILGSVIKRQLKNQGTRFRTFPVTSDLNTLGQEGERQSLVVIGELEAGLWHIWCGFSG